jgi:hypothetical protein
MKIIRDYDNESPMRICHIVENLPGNGGDANAGAIVGIDEEYLAWFYIAPGEPLSRTSLTMLAFAQDLIGPGAWAVLQARDDTSRALVRDLALHVVESYRDATEDPSGVSVHIVQTCSLARAVA